MVEPAHHTHPLARLFAEVAEGRLPAPNGTVEVFDSPPGRVDAVVGFTAHNYIATCVDRAAVLRRLPVDDLGAPLGARFLTWLASELCSAAGSVDMFFLAPPIVEDTVEPLEFRSDLAAYPRVARSVHYREDVRVYSDRSGAGIMVLGRGLAGRWEVSVEVAPGSRNCGLARRLAVAARALVPPEKPLWAQAAPANAASVRALLAAGYRPIGAEALFLRPEEKAFA